MIGALQSQNAVAPAGSFAGGSTRAPIQTTGLYQTEDQIRRQIVGMSNRGSPIYLGDVADVQRRQADPDFYVPDELGTREGWWRRLFAGRAS